MKKRKGNRVFHVQNFCTICPNDYWQQVQECCEHRYNQVSTDR